MQAAAFISPPAATGYGRCDVRMNAQGRDLYSGDYTLILAFSIAPKNTPADYMSCMIKDGYYGFLRPHLPLGHCPSKTARRGKRP